MTHSQNIHEEKTIWTNTATDNKSACTAMDAPNLDRKRGRHDFRMRRMVSWRRWWSSDIRPRPGARLNRAA